MQTSLKSLTIFCGANLGNNLAYRTVTGELGQLLALAKIRLIYGGGKVGLMGVLADHVLKGGGEVIGVIPELLATPEAAHDALSQLHIVATMHERKFMLSTLAEGFVILPGGVGSFEEFFEVLTWAQLGLHTKPCAILNIANYYDPLIHFLDHSVREGFLNQATRNQVIIENNPHVLLQRFGIIVPENKIAS